MKVAIDKVTKTGWDGPGFYIIDNDPDHDGYLFYLTHKHSDAEWSAWGVCIVDYNGIPGTNFQEFDLVGMRKLGPGETITIEP